MPLVALVMPSTSQLSVIRVLSFRKPPVSLMPLQMYRSVMVFKTTPTHPSVCTQRL
jgi:hypothetical protein